MDNNLENLFDRLKPDFDTELPSENHAKRFAQKLNVQHDTHTVNRSFSVKKIWKPLVGIAATVALIVTFFITNNQETITNDLASVSPEMAETESFFTSTITVELKKLNQAADADTQMLIKDVMIQMRKLENDYENLKSDLGQSGNDQRVIYAMITNFQNRIDLLQNALKQIELVKQLKNVSNENTNTI